MADGSTPAKKGPRTLCAEAAHAAMYPGVVPTDESMERARAVSKAVIDVAMNHITLRLNFPSRNSNG